MKINSLQISNILSFKYYHNLADVPKITFDNDLNIIIGQNGAGKSTLLEVINFLLKRVLFAPVVINQNKYQRRLELTQDDQKSIISKSNNNNFREFRLNPNWNSDSDPQNIIFDLTLENIDVQNIAFLATNRNKILNIATMFSGESIPNFDPPSNTTFQVSILLDYRKGTYTTNSTDSGSGINYILNYNLYRQFIDLHNLLNPTDLIDNLVETFSLISGYRVGFPKKLSILG